jgi:hypothetical protein
LCIGELQRKDGKEDGAVHPINSARVVDGAFRNLYGKLRDDRDKFLQLF